MGPLSPLAFKTMFNVEQLQAILANCEFKEHKFRSGTMGGGFFLQIVYDEPDVETGKPAEQHGRKWYVSSWATESEVVQTALKAVLTSQEHIGREHFRYKGKNIFQPHWDVNELLKLATESRRDQKP